MENKNRRNQIGSVVGSSVRKQSYNPAMQRVANDRARLKTQNPRLISRGGFMRGAGAVVGGTIGAGLLGTSVAKAHPSTHPEIVPQIDGSVWVYPTGRYPDDVEHVQIAVDTYSNVVLKPTKLDMSTLMYFNFGKGELRSVGHVDIKRDVTIRGEPVAPGKGIPIPNGTTSKSTIYGGGSGINYKGDIIGLNIFGSISMTQENPYEAGNPTGFNLAVEGVHFDSCQYSAILVQSSREYVNIDNCVFTNTVETEGPWTVIGGAERWSNAVSAANTIRIISGKDYDGEWSLKRFLNGAFNVTNCRFEMPGDGIFSGAINADDSDTLRSVTVTGNTIYVKNSLPSGATVGVYCRDLPNAMIRINNNTIEASASGIWISPHFIGGDQGYAEIKDNTINVVAPQFFIWPQAIGVNSSTRGALIERNTCTLNGVVGTAISNFQCSNSTIRNNHVNSIGEICFFGISIDGEDETPPRVLDGEEYREWNTELDGEWIPGLTARNNHVINNIVDGGPYLFGIDVRNAENSYIERNDFSNSYAIFGQGMVGNNSFNITFQNNKWGSVDAYEGIAGFLVVDVHFWDLMNGLLRIGPVENNTFTNENFIGDYPGWGSGMGCYMFASWFGMPPFNIPPPSNNTITALQSGTELFGYALCMQVMDSSDPDFSDGYQGLNNFPGIAKCINPSPLSKEQMMQKLMAIKARLPKNLRAQRARLFK